MLFKRCIFVCVFINSALLVMSMQSNSEDLNWNWSLLDNKTASEMNLFDSGELSKDSPLRLTKDEETWLDDSDLARKVVPKMNAVRLKMNKTRRIFVQNQASRQIFTNLIDSLDKLVAGGKLGGPLETAEEEKSTIDADERFTTGLNATRMKMRAKHGMFKTARIAAKEFIKKWGEYEEEETEKLFIDFQFKQIKAIGQDLCLNLKKADIGAKWLKRRVDTRTEELELEQSQLREQMEKNKEKVAGLAIKETKMKESLQIATNALEVSQKSHDSQLRHINTLKKRLSEMKCGKWYDFLSLGIRCLIHKIRGDIKKAKRNLKGMQVVLAKDRQRHENVRSKLRSIEADLAVNKQMSRDLTQKMGKMNNKLNNLMQCSQAIGTLQKDIAAAIVKIGGMLSGSKTLASSVTVDVSEALMQMRHIGTVLTEELEVSVTLPQLSEEDRKLIEKNLEKWKDTGFHLDMN